jgi:ATP-binding cassette subfamily F protein 3
VLEEVERGNEELRRVGREMRELEHQLEGGDEATLSRYGELSHKFEAMGGYQAESAARRVLSGLGFSEEEMLEPAALFSGGWRMRISLARLLLESPDVLLLDEPSNHLDLESLAWLEKHLTAYEGSVVTVSHDRVFLNRTVHKIADLRRNGVVLYPGDYETFVTKRDEEIVLLQKQKLQQDKEIAQQERFIERFRAKNTKAAAVQSRIKALAKIDRIVLPRAIRSMRGFRFPQPGRSGRIVVELIEVDKAYGDNVVYSGLDLKIERGFRVALVGVNGAGKSTLLKLLAGVEGIQGGHIKLGHNVNVDYFAQHQLESLNLKNTVMQEMDTVASLETHPLVRGLLGAFLFSGKEVDKQVSVLSGGEKARLALCKILLTPVSLLLMDEPTNHLDLASRESLEAALKGYEGCMVVVSHDRYFINAVCNHVLEVDRGEVRWYPGNYDDYLWKKGKEAAGASASEKKSKPKPKPTPKSAPRPNAQVDASAKEKRKEQKRREADKRQRLHDATHELKKRLDSIQRHIDELESKQKELDERLADSELYNNVAAWRDVNDERESVVRKLERAYPKWERLELQIEKAVKEADSD